MRRTERIIFTFGPLGEAGKPATLPQGTDAVAPAGKDFVRIALMAHVPDELILRRVKHIMDCGRQLDNAEAEPR